MDDERLATPEARQVTVRLASVQLSAAAIEAGRVNALTVARSAIGVGDVEVACDALGLQIHASFAGDDPSDSERTEILRRALELDGLSTLQRAALLGELAIELIFERDIKGRRQVLAEQELLLAALPIEERGWLMRSPGTFQYAGFTVEQVRDRAAWLDALPPQDLSPSARLTARIVLFYLWMRSHDGDGMARSYDQVVATGHQSTRSGAFALVVQSTMANLAGRLTDAERLSAEAVAMLNAMGVPEATNYVATTTLANTRERGTIDQLGWLADLAEKMGHHAGAGHAIAAYIRSAQGDTDYVLAALDRLDGEELADDAGHSIVIAYWAEIVAGLRDHCVAVASSTRSSRCPASTSGPAASVSAPLTGCLRCCTMRSMSPIAPTGTSPGPLSSTRRSARRRGWRVPNSTGPSRCSHEIGSTTQRRTWPPPEQSSATSSFPPVSKASPTSPPNSRTREQMGG